jgi:hypothetical protein
MATTSNTLTPEQLQEQLIDYHFGTLPPVERAAVEEALLASPESLRLYLQLKRELDGVPDPEERPSPAARARLRAAVAAAVEPGKGLRPGRGLPGLLRLLARPVPLYQTIAAAGAAACMAGLVVLTLARWGPGAGGGPEPRSAGPTGAPPAAAASPVDFARPHPVSMEVL